MKYTKRIGLWIAMVGAVLFAAAQPTVQTILPGSGCRGDSLLIIGTGYSPDTEVTFLGTPSPGDDVAAAVTFIGNTLLRVRIPLTAVTGRLRLIEDGDTITTAQIVTVFSLPTAAPAVFGTGTRCVGDTLPLRANPAGGTAPYTALWTPSASLSSTTVQNPSFFATTSGPNNLTVTITDANGCSSAAAPLAFTVNALPPAPALSGPLTVCAGETEIYTQTNVQPGTIRAWSLTGGSGTAGPGANYTANFGNTPGPFQLRLTVTATVTGCESPAGVLNGSIQASPIAAFTSPTATTYLLNDFSFVPVNAVPAGGTFSSPTPGLITSIFSQAFIDLSATASSAGFDTIIYNVTDPQTGCAGSDTLIITIVDPASDICGLDSVFCISQPISPVQIDLGNCPTAGLLFPFATDITVSVVGPGVTTIIPDSVFQFDPMSFGGPDTVVLFAIFTQLAPTIETRIVARTIRIQTLPAPFAPDVTACDGSPLPPVLASGGPGPNYLWYSNPNLQNPIFSGNGFIPVNTPPPGITSFFVTYASGGCESFADTFTIGIGNRPLPPVLPQPLLELCANSLPLPAQVTVTGADVRWYSELNNQLGPLANQGPVLLNYVAGADTTVRFYVTDSQNGCESLPDTLTLVSRRILDAGFAGLDPSYCRPAIPDTVFLFPNANPGVLSATSIFEGPGVELSAAGWIFVISQADSGNNLISHLVTDDLGCGNESLATVQVFNAATISLSGLADQYCQTPDTVLLQLTGRYNSFAIDLTPAAPGAVIPTFSGAKFLPSVATPGLNTLQISYTDVFGCTGEFESETFVVPQPNAVIDLEEGRRCLDVPLTFSSNSTITQPGVIDSLIWNLGDGTTALGATVVHAFSIERTFQVELLVVSDAGCVDTDILPVAIQAFPVVDFFWENVCEGQQLTFDNLTTPVTRQFDYRWDFGSPLLPGSTQAEPVLNAPAPGAYHVQLVASTSSGCEDSVTKRVLVHPVVTIQVNDPYFDDFEAATDWLPSNANDSTDGWSWRQTALDSQFGVIDQVRSGIQAWITDRNEGTDPENSFLNSPCFDLSQLQRPMVAFLSWTDASPSLEGAAFQFATDGKNNWETLGRPRNGIGWYENERVIVRPGGVSNDSLFGWSHRNQTDWQDSRYRLDAQLPAADTLVRFRVAFSTFGGIDSTTSGFAIDSMWIGERSKNLVAEFFGPLDQPSAANLNSTVRQPEARNPLDVRSGQFLFPEANSDPDLAALRGDAYFSRSIFYKIPTEGNQVVLDGNQLNDRFDLLTQERLDRRMLETPRALLTGLTWDAATATLLGQVAAPYVPIQNLILHTLIIAPKAKPATADTLNNLILSMLPAPDGTPVLDLERGDSARFAVRASLPGGGAARRLVAGDSVRLLVFVQDQISGEIFQSANRMVLLSEVAERKPAPGPSGAEVTTLQVYPNPASREVTVQIPDLGPVATEWTLTDLSGKTVARGTPAFGALNWTLDLDPQAEGWYQLKVWFADGSAALARIFKN